MKIGNKILIVVIAVICLYAAFLIASDVNTIYDKISHFKIEFLQKIKLPLILIEFFIVNLKNLNL